MPHYYGDTMDIGIGEGQEFATLEEAMMIREKPGVPRSEDCKFSDKPVTEEDIKFAEEVMALISGGKGCPVMNTCENSSPELKEHFTKIDQAFEDLRSNSNTEKELTDKDIQEHISLSHDINTIFANQSANNMLEGCAVVDTVSTFNGLGASCDLV